MPRNPQKMPEREASPLPAKDATANFLSRLDLGDPILKARLIAQVAALDPEAEQEVLDWIERVYDDKDWTPQE